MKRRTKRILALAAGFAIAMILMSIAIYFGYTGAYRTGGALFTVRLCGLPIYDLTWTGDAYAGASRGPYMGLVCGVCMIAALAAELIAERVRRK